MKTIRLIFKFFLKSIFGLLFLLNSSIIYSQESNSLHKIGSIEEVVQPFIKSPFKEAVYKKYNLQVTAEKTYTINIESNLCKKGSYYLFGQVEGYKNATFYIKGNDNKIEGKLLFYENKEAYAISTNKQKEILIEHVDIHTQVCIIENTDSVIKAQKENNKKKLKYNKNKGAMPELESFPGAPGVIYLDFDGEQVSGGGWGTVNAEASGLTNEEIEEIFYVVSEDYAPFNINVTTKRSVYDSAKTGSRQMVIFNTTYPNNPGVAKLNSFNDNSDDPCWVKMGGPVASAIKAANVGSHEAGHTFGLRHDGNASVEYYPGHSFYRVIMGTVSDGYSQFCKGEYSGANNSEDDLEMLSGTTNGVGYRIDDHGNDIDNSTNLLIENNGIVSDTENYGIIGKSLDVDLFKMDVGAGKIELEVRPANKYDYSQNLDLKVRLLDASGEEIASEDVNGFGASALNETVAEGVYYIEIDGVGLGDPLGDGYTDYGSLGQYFISGQVPPASLSVSDFDDENNFQIYPNPTNGEINIRYNFSDTTRVSYEILTAHGAIVTNNTFSDNNNREKLDISSLAKGLYLLKLKTDKQIYTFKIIIK